MNPLLTRRFTHNASRLGALLLLGAALSFSGCATRTEVAAIVAQSNAAMLAGQLGGLPQKSGGPARENWEDANERIESFIAAHPDQKAITAPLRIRQAMLLLAQKQFSLARAAFDAADKNNLHTDRDQALKRQKDHLLWWFAVGSEDTWNDTDQQRGMSALAAFKEECETKLPNGSEIRDYFAELRAYIGIASAGQTTDAAVERARFKEAIDVFGHNLTDDDLAALRDGKETSSDSPALTATVRRRLRAKVLFEFAKKKNRPDVGAHAENQIIERMINP